MSIGHIPRHRPGRRGLAAAIATLAVGAGVAIAGVAGASESITIYSVENGGLPCFSTVAGKTTCAPGERGDVTIRTGDTVTWNFTAANGNWHNAASKKPAGSTPPNAAWDGRGDTEAPLQQGGTRPWTFSVAGVYEFVCGAHPSMVGTVTVEGDPVETPEPTPTPTPTASPIATASPTATPTATSDDHTTTPSPGHASVKDTQAPRLAAVSTKKIAAGAQLRFWLSEAATVKISARKRGAKAVVTSATVQAPAGTRRLTLRSKAFKKGTYTVQLRATDAMGNTGALTSKTLRVK